MDITQFSELEQHDLIEVEKRSLLMRFMDTVAVVYASSGPTKEARELIKKLRSVYFVGAEDQDKKRVEQAARELEALSRKVFTVTPAKRRGGPAILEISK